MEKKIFAVVCDEIDGGYYLESIEDIDQLIKAGADPIDLSIKKWEFIVEAYENGIEGHIKDGGDRTCALCIEYFAYACKGCPVYEATGRMSCIGTPYRDYWRHYDGATQKERLGTAIAEVEFLRGLRAKQ